MTEFYRSGHWRNDAWGNTIWIPGHNVVRDDFSKSSGYSRTATEIELSQYGGINNLNRSYSASARFIKPNAKCPVCGEEVYFYQNTFGSRVYFDELGPPWPKHPCTDNDQYNKFGGRAISKEPWLRRDFEISRIINLLKAQDRIRLKTFNTWMVIRILRKIRLKTGCVLIVSNVTHPKNPPIALHLPKVKSWMHHKAVLFLRGDKIARWNISLMQPEVVETSRVLELNSLIAMLKN